MTRRHRSNAVALAGIAVFAVLAAGNGLDRAAARNPALVPYVPGMFAAQAWRTEAETALASGKGGNGIAAAEEAVRSDPVDPRSTALLGATSLAGRHPLRADLAFRVAARLGWRDPLTQIYFMNAALQTAQPRLAALRLDALLRQAPNFPVRDMLIAQLAGAPGGQEALAERLAARPSWTGSFMGDGTGLPLTTIQKRAEVIAALPAPKWGCETVVQLVQRLVLQGGAASAKALWLAQCDGAVSGIADPHFAALQRGRTPVPFEWNLVGDGAISATAAEDGKGLVIRAGGAAARPVAWQLLVLPPGRYRLDWTATTIAGTAAPSLSLSLTCGFDERRPVDAKPGPVPGQLSAVIDADGTCQGQYLTLWAAPNADEVRFDNPVLIPLR